MSKEPKSYGIMPDKLAARGDKGWENPRDEDRTPETRDPNMDRYAIGSNDERFRSK